MQKIVHQKVVPDPFLLLVNISKQTPQRQILTIVLGNRRKSAVKHSIEKPIVFNFVNLSTFLCPRFYSRLFSVT